MNENIRDLVLIYTLSNSDQQSEFASFSEVFHKTYYDLLDKIQIEKKNKRFKTNANTFFVVKAYLQNLNLTGITREDFIEKVINLIKTDYTASQEPYKKYLDKHPPISFV